MSPTPPALHVRDLRHAFRSPEGGALPVLELPELDVQAGERLVVQGASGGGKTTLLHLVAGILPVQHGTLEVAGISLKGMSEAARDRFRARHVGYLFQAFHLLPQLTALENVAVALTFQGIRPAAARQAAAASLQRVGLADRRGHRPHQLSVGQQQRVAIARALVGHPSIVLADEPTSSLDPQRAEEALALLEAFAEERGAALLIVTHDPAVVARASRVVRLEAPRPAEAAR
ncbi:MAG: ABC transporter ATP-binding protein [Planctomycetota bacterium]